ncbi:MAG TPA: hypothetical protein VFN57_12065 [Thermomicrobiaceae bacterium]|nr:hypothetical protein [Thermomicrobiaceae bacterium]
MESSPRTDAAEMAVWKPPAIGVGSLFGLFLAATAVRHSPIAGAARGVMVVLSTVVATATAVYGVKMAVDARLRGWSSAVGGLVMVVMGAYSAFHVLSSALKKS